MPQDSSANVAGGAFREARGARLPTVADAGEISPRSPAPKKSRASSKSRASTRGRIRAVDEEGGAKRSGSVLDLLANAAAQTG